MSLDIGLIAPNVGAATTVALAVFLLLCSSLFVSTAALRRSRAVARASAALVAELSVYKDAAVTLGQHLERRPTNTSQSVSARPVTTLPVASDSMLGVQVTRTSGNDESERAFELARQGASVDDLVAACDISRTEAGLMLAMSRRGRRALGG